jgi:hypothetical protein
LESEVVDAKAEVRKHKTIDNDAPLHEAQLRIEG